MKDARGHGSNPRTMAEDNEALAPMRGMKAADAMAQLHGEGSGVVNAGTPAHPSLAADRAALAPFRGMKASVALGMLNLIHQHKFGAAHQQGVNAMPRQM